jgi:hypothetical protein
MVLEMGTESLEESLRKLFRRQPKGSTYQYTPTTVHRILVQVLKAVDQLHQKSENKKQQFKKIIKL